MIRLATNVRQIVDVMNTQQSKEDWPYTLNAENLQEADNRFDLLLDDLPSYFSLDAEFAPSERQTTPQQKRIECERWLIHQQLFDLQIKLHSSRDHRDHVSSVF